ncbi:hypothetical protein T492DRAFT_833465 [Pavlovales sp. CCMP2436]|nr:hypothetical protein T492DRAFT_833465 [Pavlovales sp. CCMP2436]
MTASRHEMKVRTRIGVVVDDQASASITCKGRPELKTSNEMNHRRRRTGEITVTKKCYHCYRMQARDSRSASGSARLPRSSESSVGSRSLEDVTLLDPPDPQILRILGRLQIGQIGQIQRVSDVTSDPRIGRSR